MSLNFGVALVICIWWKIYQDLFLQIWPGACPWIVLLWFFIYFFFFLGECVGQIVCWDYTVFHESNISCSLASRLLWTVSAVSTVALKHNVDDWRHLRIYPVCICTVLSAYIFQYHRTSVVQVCCQSWRTEVQWYLQSSLSVFFVIPERNCCWNSQSFPLGISDLCLWQMYKVSQTFDLEWRVDLLHKFCDTLVQMWVTICGTMFNSNTSLCYAVASFLSTLAVWHTFISVNVCSAFHMSTRTSGSLTNFYMLMFAVHSTCLLGQVAVWQTFIPVSVHSAFHMSTRTSGSFVPFASQQSSFLTHVVWSECWHCIVLSSFCFCG